MNRYVLALLAILTTVTAAGAATLEANFDRIFDVRPGTLFALNNTNGHITIRSWDQPRVQVHAVKKVESRDPEAARKAMAELTIEPTVSADGRSEEHTSELQSPYDLVCRLLLEKKKIRAR